MFRNKNVIVGVIAVVLLIGVFSVVGNNVFHSSQNKTSQISKTSKKDPQKVIEKIRDRYPLTFEGFNGWGEASMPALNENEDVYKAPNGYDDEGRAKNIKGLSNGDEVTVTISEATAEMYGLPDLAGEKITYTVDGLTGVDFAKVASETRDAVIKSLGDRTVTLDKVLYDVSEKDDDSFLVVDVYTQFTYDKDSSNLVSNDKLSSTDSFEVGDTVYYHSKTEYRLDASGNLEGAIFHDNADNTTKIDNYFSKKAFDMKAYGSAKTLDE